MGNLSSHNWPSQRKREREEEESAEGVSTSSSKRAKEESTEGASTSSSISPEATGVGSGQYDVFLSFRGLDTRKGFTDHLYHSLKKAGIGLRMFKDDKSIPIGERFDWQILNAITQCKISIPIISENYASSKWCLRELAHMMKRKESSAHTILPIFYKVSPSDVRHLKENFEEAFSSGQKHLDEKEIQEGRRALEEVGKLERWESEKFANGHEGELIKHVVETVRSKLWKYFQLDVPKELVGLDDPLKEIMNVIDSPSINARMIGIYGMGGIGKTTLAKCIFDQLSNKFDRVSFLPDVRETTKCSGITRLQKILIKDILDYKSDVSRPFEGINIIKSGFTGIKALIFLDDVDGQQQLDALAREPDWFGEGSLIIVTTRKKAVLEQSKFKVDLKYELNGLDDVQSLLLFSRHAFRKDHSPLDFATISCDIIHTMGGLPLALEVVGAYLYEKDRKVWEETRKILESQPFDEVQEKLRISYDDLKKEHKQIFLDIACFSFITYFNSEGGFAMCMWEGCGFYPIRAVEELKSRCLIKIGKYGKFEMHDQLRDLGRRIFCEEQHIENHCGPWDADYNGVPRVLSHRDCPWFYDLMRAALSGDKDFSEVRWLRWTVRTNDKSKVSLSKTNLHLPKLAVLDLAESDITEDWEGWSSLRASKRLRALNLAYCSNLKSIPDLSAFTQLKILNLYGCYKLKHLPSWIGKLTNLVSLRLGDTYGRHKLKELPEEVGELRDLEELELDGSGITQFPTSICSLRKLKKLVAKRFESLRAIPISIGDLQNLQHLEFSVVAIEEVPSDIGRLKNLQVLYITCAPISDLPKSILNLSSLQRLHLVGCDKLQSLPELPSSLTDLSIPGQSLRLPQLSSLICLEKLDLYEDIPELPSRLLKLDGFRYLESFSIWCCSSIETLNLSELIHLKRLLVLCCNNLVKIQGLDNLVFLESISIRSCNSIENLLFQKSEYLKELDVCGCNNLVEIQGPLDGAKFLECLSIEHCKSLEALPDLTGCNKLQCLSVRDCKKLTQLRGTEELNLFRWHISGCDSLEAIPKLSGIRGPW